MKPFLAHRTRAAGRSLVLNLLGGFGSGLLELRLPDGTLRRYGDPALTAEPNRKPDAVLHVKNDRFFSRCLLHGDIGFGESLMEDEWESPEPVAVVSWLIHNLDNIPGVSGSKRRRPGFNLLRLANRLGHLLRPNTRATGRRNIAEHYDLSNEFFATFLDHTMTYSSGLWENASNLQSAQEAKYDRLCQTLRLQPDDRVLEIGCGWGGFAVHAASRYGCRVEGVTISQQQFEYARERVALAGLDDRVTIRLCDYRDLREPFDKIVSIEMLEAVGHRYHPAFADTCARLLAPGGLLALQFITCADDRYVQLRAGVDFIQKHIFPGSLLLSLNRMNELLTHSGGFVMHDLKDLGADYARTLRVWRERFRDRRRVILGMGFDERFLRKWDYYLSYCEAAFATRNISVVQTLHTRPNNAATLAKAAARHQEISSAESRRGRRAETAETGLSHV